MCRKKLRNYLFIILYMVQGGSVSKKENPNFSGVGVAFILNFPDGFFKTMRKPGKKFTFVISERGENLLTRWFIGIRNKLVLNFTGQHRIIVNLTFGFMDITKYLVRSSPREQVRLTT